MARPTTAATGKDPSPSTPASTRHRLPRLPASLRGTQVSRQASNPHLSLVFADPSLSHGAKPSRPGSLASEDALSRQLDAGGQAMGLRSRRSSSATVRTVRTLSGMSSPGIEEEGEDSAGLGETGAGGEAEAGPSTLRKPAKSLAAISLYGLSPEEDTGVLGSDTGKRYDQGSLRRPNPKESTSWLRWNSPTTSFPRSRAASTISRGTGKGKEKADDSAATEDSGGQASPVAPVDPDTGITRDVAALDTSNDSTSTASAMPVSDLPPLPLPPETFLQPPATVSAGSKPPSTPRRNWWSRAASPTPRQVSRSAAKAVSTGPADDLPTPDPAVATTASLTAETESGSTTLISAALTSPDPKETAIHPAPAPAGDAPIAPSPTSSEQPSVPDATSSLAASDTAHQRVVAADIPLGGWRAYLWGSSATAAPAGAKEALPIFNSEPTDISELPAKDQAVAQVSDQSSAIAVDGDTVDTQVDVESAQSSKSSIPSQHTSLEGDPVAAPAVNSNPGSGWGTFLYSLVAPQLAVARSLEIAQPAASLSSRDDQPNSLLPDTAIAVSPVEEQRPVPAPDPIQESPSIAPPAAIASAGSSEPSNPVDPAPASHMPSSDNDTSAPPAAPTTGTTSWLSYLAYRSSQKKVTTGSLRSSAPRNSSEIDEEVMDFSSDPDFPTDSATSTSTLTKKPTLTQNDQKMPSGPASISTDKDKMAPPKTIPNKTSTLSVRGKRLSISSTRSGGSLTPLSSSPKTVSGLPEPKIDPSPKAPEGSSLPAPPTVPARQPNLVIPTFTNTFDRPPRSFMPVPPLAPVSETASTTTGAGPSLAWRALSVAGSYVYSGSTADKGKGKAEPEKTDHQEEVRGRKEGRNIGADLPRKLGLDGGGADEGWKHVRRVAVVGVHGWFPAKMLNSVIGEPTGTSQKFASMMGAAVKQFFSDKGVDDIRLTLMPLEGEGTIDSRVDKLYKSYLSNPAWINDLRRADAIFFAAHSQGCIVTTHLLSRMIAQGHIRTPLNSEAVARCEWAFGPIGLMPPESRLRGTGGKGLKNSFGPVPPGSEGGHQKVCMLAMCGVHLGPLYSISTSTVIQPYLQWFENAAARELFEFQEDGSAVSQAYHKALGMVLENEVKVVLLASLNDQVVPIYGASFSTANHPLLLRALFVDGASYSQTDFMTNLLCFAFMLRNAGLDDQRLIEHLSEATAGSLTGIGHSTPYEEPQSYALAVQYLFLSGPSRQPISPLHVEPFSARDTRNEYELPWIMRAIVDSPEVKDLFPGELRDLKEGVVRWKPITKVLKEVKKRLEPMAGRQSRLRPIPNSPSSLSINTLSDAAPVGSTARARENSVGMLKRDW